MPSGDRRENSFNTLIVWPRLVARREIVLATVAARLWKPMASKLTCKYWAMVKSNGVTATFSLLSANMRLSAASIPFSAIHARASSAIGSSPIVSYMSSPSMLRVCSLTFSACDTRCSNLRGFCFGRTSPTAPVVSLYGLSLYACTMRSKAWFR